MSQLNRIAKGFLDLVGSQQQGRNPPVYSDAVSPVLRMNELYLGETLALLQVDATHTGVQTNSVAVPADQVWALLGFGVNALVLGGGHTETWCLELGRAPRTVAGSVATPVGLQWCSKDLASGVSGAQGDADAIHFPAPLILHGGTNILMRLLKRDATGIRTTTLTLTLHALTA